MGASNSSKELTVTESDLNVLTEALNFTNWGLIVFGSFLSFIEICCICFAIYALCLQRKSNHTSVFIVNLLLSDLLQIISLIFLTYQLSLIILSPVCTYVYMYAFTAATYFMACIAVERYILISHPLWYRSHYSAKFSYSVIFVGWLESLFYLIFLYRFDFEIESNTLLVVLTVIRYLIPYLVVVLAFVGTWRALSHSISVTSYKRQLVLGTLSLVLVNYTIVVFPIILYLVTDFKSDLFKFAIFLFFVNPLADCLLYVFARSDAGNIMSIFPCCRGLVSNQRTAISTTM